MGERGRGHAAREHGQEGRQRGHRGVRPGVRNAGRAPRQPERRQARARQHHPPAPRRAHEQPPGEREHRVEAHLDDQRPHRRVELALDGADVVLPEGGEERQLPGAHLVAVPGAAQQPEGAEHRDPVGGHDARRALDREAPQARRRALVQGARHPRPGQQVAREHEEEHHAQAQLARQQAHELAAVVGVLHREHPHVQGEDAESGEAAQAVEGMVASAHPLASCPPARAPRARLTELKNGRRRPLHRRRPRAHIVRHRVGGPAATYNIACQT